MSDFVPADYSKCSGYPRRCLTGCRYAMLDEAYFCRAYNRKHFGQERVQVEIVPDRRPWWERERERRAR